MASRKGPSPRSLAATQQPSLTLRAGRGFSRVPGLFALQEGAGRRKGARQEAQRRPHSGRGHLPCLAAYHSPQGKS